MTREQLAKKTPKQLARMVLHYAKCDLGGCQRCYVHWDDGRPRGESFQAMLPEPIEIILAKALLATTRKEP
jgi:hypothetical protein